MDNSSQVIDNLRPDDHLLIIVSTGREDHGLKALLAFAIADTALNMGVKTSIFLTLSGVLWGYKAKVSSFHIPGYEPLDDLINRFVESDLSHLMMCSPCAEGFCSIENLAPIREQVQLVGLSHITDLASSSKVISF